jgi:tetratricopeptide (TPR) repeat protein
MQSKGLNSIYLLFLVMVIAGCTTQKNTFITRTYHNITSKYNILFNENESFKKGVNKIDDSFEDDYAELLPVFTYGDKELASTVMPEMDRTIKKGTKLVTMHSITVKPKLKDNTALSPKERAFYNKNEFNKWVDDNYFLIGKAHFYKHDYNLAKETFMFILNEFKNEEVVYDTRIWLARLYNETGEYKSSEEILEELEDDVNIPKRLKVDFYTTVADLHIKQGNLAEAIPNLENARDKIRKKRLRVRYTFILAQLYEKQGDLQKASKLYNKVVKMNPPYEMTFNAKINRALAYEKGYGSVREIEKQLTRMLKDEKNKEYKDQIYYALGNLAYKEGNTTKAIMQYKKSVRHSIDNSNQKTRSFLTLADIYYDQPDYVNAQAYYDSAVVLIELDYPAYDIIFAKSQSLTKLVKEIQIFNLEDSVQRLAKLSTNELHSFIDKIIEDVKQKEQEEMLRRQEEALDRQFARESEYDRKMGKQNVGGSSMWYFYNQTARSLGYKEFKIKWGNRKLEDDWRRKNKSTTVFSEGAGDEVADIASGEESKTAKAVSNKTREYYLRNIPLTDSMLSASHKRIENALYNMGLIYKNDLKDYEKFIESFKELIKRYPRTEYLLSAYYYLYDIYNKQNNKALVENYKNRIINQFPNSTYAKLLTNPNYVKELEAEQNKVNIYYEETYRRYRAEQYNDVIRRADFAFDNYTDDELISKFAFLRALSIGRTMNVKTFEKALYEILSSYPQTEVAESVKNILVYLDKEHPELKEEIEMEVAKKLYEFTEDMEHLFALIVSKETNINQLVFNIINFNIDNYDQLNLKVESSELNSTHDIVTVVSFRNTRESLNYFNSIARNGDVFRDVQREGVHSMVISTENLRILKDDKAVDRYLKFFEEYYQ